MVMLMKIKLTTKIAFYTIILVFIAVIISIFLSGKWYIEQMMINIEDNTLNVVRIIARSDTIIDGLTNEDDSGKIQSYITKLQDTLENIDVMVVADVNGKRYAHTKNDLVGQMFSADDYVDALNKGNTYVSIGPGTMGYSLRAFAPVKADDGTILGFVTAGTLLDSIAQAKKAMTVMAMVFVFISGSLGIIGAGIMARYIKKKLLNYEPEDIAKLYLENVVILKTIREGIIEINDEDKIVVMNKTAQDYLKINNWQHLDINDIFPNCQLSKVVATGKPLLDYQCALGNKVVMTNNVPIITAKGKVIGAVCSFRDQREINQLANEITGVKRIVDALRATTHEFKNKLHVILGLIETGRLEQAKQYIGAINDELQTTISDIMKHIKEPTIAALFIGKIQRMHETKINWHLSSDSLISDAQGFEINDLITIIGNLLDNAIDELNSLDIENKHISCTVKLSNNYLFLKICDNGSGVKEEQKIFTKGYTTKNGSRGYGLYLVKQLVDKYDGKISIDSSLENGSCFALEMKGIYHD